MDLNCLPMVPTFVAFLAAGHLLLFKHIHMREQESNWAREKVPFILDAFCLVAQDNSSQAWRA